MDRRGCRRENGRTEALVIVRSTPSRVPEHCVRLIEPHHLLFCELPQVRVKVGDTVGVTGADSFAEGVANLLLVGLGVDIENCVIVGVCCHLRRVGCEQRCQLFSGTISETLCFTASWVFRAAGP